MYPYVGACLFSLRVPGGFGERAEFGVNTSHVSPYDVPSALTLVGHGAGAAGVRSQYEPRIALCLVAALPALGLSGPALADCCERALPSLGASLPSRSPGTLALVGAAPRGPQGALGIGWGVGCGHPALLLDRTALGALPL